MVVCLCSTLSPCFITPGAIISLSKKVTECVASLCNRVVSLCRVRAGMTE